MFLFPVLFSSQSVQSPGDQHTFSPKYKMYIFQHHPCHKMYIKCIYFPTIIANFFCIHFLQNMKCIFFDISFAICFNIHFLQNLKCIFSNVNFEYNHVSIEIFGKILYRIFFNSNESIVMI